MAPDRRDVISGQIAALVLFGQIAALVLFGQDVRKVLPYADFTPAEKRQGARQRLLMRVAQARYRAKHPRRRT